MLPRKIELGLTDGDGTFRLELMNPKTYHVQPLFNLHDFQITRDDQGIWNQTAGEPIDQLYIGSLGADLNEIDQEEFYFPIVYRAEAVLCTIGIGEKGYGVMFNGNLVAEVKQSHHDKSWHVIKGGPLDNNTLLEIGRQIDDWA